MVSHPKEALFDVLRIGSELDAHSQDVLSVVGMESSEGHTDVESTTSDFSTRQIELFEVIAFESVEFWRECLVHSIKLLA
jgi:hypothetical protein